MGSEMKVHAFVDFFAPNTLSQLKHFVLLKTVFLSSLRAFTFDNRLHGDQTTSKPNNFLQSIRRWKKVFTWLLNYELNWIVKLYYALLCNRKAVDRRLQFHVMPNKTCGEFHSRLVRALVVHEDADKFVCHFSYDSFSAHIKYLFKQKFHFITFFL